MIGPHKNLNQLKSIEAEIANYRREIRERRIKISELIYERQQIKITLRLSTRILSLLSEHEKGLTAKQISHYLKEDPNNVNSYCSWTIKKELLRRELNPDDIWIYFITAEGKNQLNHE